MVTVFDVFGGNMAKRREIGMYWKQIIG